MGIGEFYAGGNPAMDWHPIGGRGSRNSSSRFMPQKPQEIGAGLMGHLAGMQTMHVEGF